MTGRGRGRGRGSAGGGGGYNQGRGSSGARGGYYPNSSQSCSYPQRQQGSSSQSQTSGSGFNTGRGGGRGVAVDWSNKPMPTDLPPASISAKWNPPESIPEVASEVQKIMPRLQGPGKSFGSKILDDTNFFEARINLPKEVHRYKVTIVKNKDSTAKREQLKKGKKGAMDCHPGSSKGAASGDGDKPGDGGDGAGNQAVAMTVKSDLRKKILPVLITRLRQNNPEIGIIHDFADTLYTTGCLPVTDHGPHLILHMDLPNEDSSQWIYEIRLEISVFEVNWNRARELLNSPVRLDQSELLELLEIKQLYNILLKNLGEDRFVPLGRSSLMKISREVTENNSLGSGLMNWSGVSAVNTVGSTWKPFLNIDIQNSAYYIGQKVIPAIANILGRNKAEDVTTWHQGDFQAVKSILISCKVRRFVNNQPHDKPVTGIADRPARELFFMVGQEEISVADHLSNQGVQLRWPNGPVLQFGQDRRTQVPAELCTIKEGQNFNRLLPSKFSQDKMLKLATEKPDRKHFNILRAVEDLSLENNELLKQFGVSFAGNMLELPGTRVLAAPQLCYGKEVGLANLNLNAGIRRGRITPEDGVWNIGSTKMEFFHPETIQAWAVLTVGFKVDENSHKQFVRVLKREAASRGLIFPDPAGFYTEYIDKHAKHSENVKCLKTRMQNLEGLFKGKTKCLLVCIIPQKGSVFYSQVKQAAELAINSSGILTQCIVGDNYEKANRSVVNNLLLKINAKLGGTNHVPVIPEPDLNKINIMSIPTLVLGIDVNHPSRPVTGEVGQPSFAAVTGSIDRSGMPYMMHVQAQMLNHDARFAGAAEVIQNLEGIVKNMLIQFYRKTKTKPCRIIVYRDGVGDSQFPEILQKEMQAIRRACTSVASEYKPAITIIAVQKRHKVRFFLKSDDGQISSDNVPPGTVVDTEIVQGSDFYLVSHKGNLGTSRPTHYHVLWDDSDFSADELQALTYFLCYMDSRCNRSVSYPAPTYYAHWAAFRAKNLAAGTYTDWDGTQESLDNLNENIKRSLNIQTDFPMHFI